MTGHAGGIASSLELDESELVEPEVDIDRPVELDVLVTG
jgi:hypothetical protein